MLLDSATLGTLRTYAAKLQHPVSFKLLGGEHPKRGELIQLLDSVASISDLLSVEHSKTDAPVREGLSFEIIANGAQTGIVFSGIPGGHEFNSFILATLQAGGHALKLDPAVQEQIRQIDRPLVFESVISLDCHVCPDIVQTFNQMALLNPTIQHEMIDGSLHPSLVSERNIQGVPAVYLDKKPFANGAISVIDILEKIGAAPPPASTFEDDAESDSCDVAIIGGGPAAVSAAIYTARKGLDVVLIAEKIGGQLNDTQGIENFISSKATTGQELTANLRQHLAEYSIRIREELRVKAINIEAEDTTELWLSTGQALKARTTIIATGARWRELGVPGEKENIGRGVAYCPHCDGPFFKDKDVTVVGGGNSGVEAALDLSNIARSVTIIEYADQFKADQVLLDKVEAADNITSMTGVATEAIVSDGAGVTGMRLMKRALEESFEHKTDGVFVQIGLVPNSQFLDGAVTLNAFGEIAINDRCETSRPGIFACGDVTDVPHKQIIVAMGEGAKAGLGAFEYLLKSTSAT